jgi:hypothetical protein
LHMTIRLSLVCQISFFIPFVPSKFMSHFHTQWNKRQADTPLHIQKNKAKWERITR